MEPVVTGPVRGAGAPRASRVQSVDRAMRLLRAVADATTVDSTATLLAGACGLNRATAWRILSTLETHGMVSCDRTTGRWSLGPGLLDIARVAELAAVVQGAHPVLEQLSRETGETAALAVVTGAGLTYVDEVASHSVVAATWRGRTVPLHATSTGKALLSVTDPDEVVLMLGERLQRYTPTTVTDLPTLLEEIELTRRRGWGACRGEYDVSAHGVSAPVLDVNGHLRAVLSIWGPGDRVTESRLDELGTLIRDATAQLGRHWAEHSTA